ncbi:MAG: CPBP family intramembrane metalloprotease [Clostridia bacterium]|nr:CPBP family intramembrane metalloprotease [Clostridia bacterium]
MPPFRKYAYPMDAEYRPWPRRPKVFDALALYLLAMAGLLVFTCLRAAIPALNRYGIGGAAAEVMLLLLPCLRFIRGHDGAKPAVRLVPIDAQTGLLCALLGLCCVHFASCLGDWWCLLLDALGARIPQGASLAGAGAWELALRVLAQGLVPAVCEEILLRGVVFSAMERRGTRFALFVSAVLFAALHGSFTALPVQLLMGLVFGFATLAGASVLGAVLCHGGYNIWLLLRSAWFDSGLRAGDYARWTDYLNARGGVGQLALSTAISLVFVCGAMVLLRRARQRHRRPLNPMLRPRPLAMDTHTMMVLVSICVTASALYLTDLLGLFGGL